jgi:hypothetical protein
VVTGRTNLPKVPPNPVPKRFEGRDPGACVHRAIWRDLLREITSMRIGTRVEKTEKEEVWYEFP